MISIIIPVLNEDKILANTLEQFLNQKIAHEIIVIDGGSHDTTCEIAKNSQVVTQLLHANKGRANQMNAGAKNASGDWLLFLHADTKMPAQALSKIENLNHKVQAGGFRHRFSGQTWGLKIISLIDNFRCQRTRIMYGDQAMFIRRTVFEEIGGFPQRNILEDVYFCLQVKNHTEAKLMDDYVITDSRKFKQMGIWRSFYYLTVILTRIRLGLPVADNYPFFKDVR